MTHDILSFPDGFLWGTATAAHQVEGGNVYNDWWAWEQQPGHIRDGSRSGQASDWWSRAEQDLRTAAELGQNSHRLSVEWSRLEPTEGAWDEPTLERYRQILSFMRAQGLEPMVTLHHFTLPLWLAQRGGWENPASVDCFAHHVQRVVGALGDLCSLWCTLNEPALCVAFGYVTGEWPPTRKDIRAARKALINMAQAHARAYEIIHTGQSSARVGYAKHMRPFDPAHPARLADRLGATLLDRLFNEAELAAFADGTLLFPIGWAMRSGRVPAYLDFMGLNYYSRDMVAFDLHYKDDFFLHRFAKPDAPFSMEGWGEIYPEGLYRCLQRLAGLGVPLYVTEFGIPDNDDSQRPRFLVTHVAEIQRAIRNGVDVRGVYFWSLVDNFEWVDGWNARFGLIALNPATQARRLTRSAGVYARMARANGLERALVTEVAPDRVAALFPPPATQ